MLTCNGYDFIGFNKPISVTDRSLAITGIGFGDKQGIVRFGRTRASVTRWDKKVDPATKAVRTELRIDVRMPAGVQQSAALIIDTANGKGIWRLPPGRTWDDVLGGHPANLFLDADATISSWSDLLAEDTNPNNLSIAKFQMLGWTLVAIVIYSIMFLTGLEMGEPTLPVIDGTVVALQGISHSTYVVDKALKKPEP